MNLYFKALLGAVFTAGIAVFMLTIVVKIITKVFKIKTTRPSYITVLSILLFFGMLVYLRGLLDSGSSFALIGILVSALIYPIPIMLSAIGLWKMKKWGLILLTCIMLLVQIYQIIAKLWTPMSLIYFIPVMPAFIYFRKMK